MAGLVLRISGCAAHSTARLLLQSRFDVGVSPMNADPSGAPTIAIEDGEPLDERPVPDGLKLPMPAEGGGWPRVRLKPKDDWRQVGPTPILLDAPAWCSAPDASVSGWRCCSFLCRHWRRRLSAN
jgi:hypothetical protein